MKQKVQQQITYLNLILFTCYISCVFSVQNKIFEQNGIELTEISSQQWKWHYNSIDQNSENEVIYSYVDLEENNLNNENNVLEYEINLKRHSQNADSYVCFGFYPQDQLSDLQQNNHQSHKNNAVVACSDDYMNNPYGSIAKQGEPTLREIDNYQLKLESGVLFIQSERKNNFRADFILDVNKKYVPYIEMYKTSQFQLLELDPNTNQPISQQQQQDQEQIVDQMESATWSSPSSTVSINSEGSFVGSSTGRGNIYVPIDFGLQDKQKWTVQIQVHQNMGWICFGVMQLEKMDQILANPDQSYYGDSYSACTDHTEYSQLDSSQIEVIGELPYRAQSTGEIFEIEYRKNLLVVSNEVYGGNSRIEITLDQYTNYVPWIETYGEHYLILQNNLEAPKEIQHYEFNWQTHSSYSEISQDNNLAKSLGVANPVIIFNDQKLRSGFSYSLKILDHTQEGWVCFGVVDYNTINTILDNPDSHYYSQSASTCTDRTFYNSFGQYTLKHGEESMPYREETIGKTYLIEYQGNSLKISDQQGEFVANFNLNAQKQYIPFIEIQNKHEIILSKGKITKNQLPTLNLQDFELGHFNRILNDTFLFDAHWKTYSAYGKFDEEDILTAQESTTDTDKFVSAFSAIQLKPGYQIEIDVLSHDPLGYICAGIISSNEQTNLKYNPDENYLQNSTSICTDTNIFENGLETQQIQGEFPDSQDPKKFTILFLQNKLVLKYDTYLQIFTLQESHSYFPFVQTFKPQKLKFQNYKYFSKELIPVQSYNATWETYSNGGLIFDDKFTISQIEDEQFTQAYVDVPLQKFSQFKVEVVEHDDLQSQWICFGLYPRSNKQDLFQNASQNLHQNSISACTDDTYFDYFDNQSIEKYGQMPYEEDSISKEFLVQLFDNVVKIQQIDSDFYVSFRIDPSENYLPYVELKGRQIVKIYDFLTFNIKKKPENFYTQDIINEVLQQNEQDGQQSLFPDLDLDETIYEKQNQVSPSLQFFGHEVETTPLNDGNLLQVNTIGDDSQVNGASSLRFKNQQFTWFVKIENVKPDSLVILGVIHENSRSHIEDYLEDRSTSQNIARISTDSSVFNGQGRSKTKGRLPKGIQNINKIFKITYQPGALFISDLSGSFSTTFELQLDEFYYFYVQIKGEVELKITKTTPDLESPIVDDQEDDQEDNFQQQDVQDQQNQDEDEEFIPDYLDGQYPITYYEKFGENLKIKYKEATQNKPEKFYLNSKKQDGQGTFIGKQLLSQSSKTWYIKVRKIKDNAKFTIGLVKSSYLQGLQDSPSDNLEVNPNILGMRSPGYSYSNIQNIHSQQGEMTDVYQDNVSNIWYRCDFDADNYQFTINELSSDYKVVFNLDLQAQYYPFIQSIKLVRLRVSENAPRRYQDKVEQITAQFNQNINSITYEEEDSVDEDVDDNQEEENTTTVQSAQQTDNNPQQDQQSQSQDQQDQETLSASIEGTLDYQVKQWKLQNNGDRLQKIQDNLCEGRVKNPVNFFIANTLQNEQTWSYKILTHENTGFICFGILPVQVLENVKNLPDNFHYENSVSVCTDKSFYNGPSWADIYVQGNLKKREQNQGITYHLTYYKDKLLVQEKDGHFKAQFNFPENIEFIPWFEIYGSHLMTLDPSLQEQGDKVEPFQELPAPQVQQDYYEEEIVVQDDNIIQTFHHADELSEDSIDDDDDEPYIDEDDEENQQPPQSVTSQQDQGQQNLQTSCVTIYHECGYNGDSVKVCGDEEFAAEQNIRSIQVPEGTCVSLLSTRQEGYTSVYMGDIECIDDNVNPELLQEKLKVYKGEIRKENEISLLELKEQFLREKQQQKQNIISNVQRKNSHLRRQQQQKGIHYNNQNFANKEKQINKISIQMISKQQLLSMIQKE